MQRPRPLTELRVRELQAAALRVISRRGLAGATMQEIADEAGLAKGTLYLYFKDREDLLEKAADFAFSKLGERLDAIVPDIPQFSEKLRALIRTEIAFFDEHREFFRVYIALKQPPVGSPNARRRRACHPRYAAHLARLERLLRQAMDHGDVRPCDPSRLAVFVSESAVALVLRRLSEEAPPPADEDAAWMTDLLLHGLATKGDR